jgi:hypothetical protein
MANPAPLIAADILDLSAPRFSRAEATLDQSRLKSIALQYDHVYITARSRPEIERALEDGTLQEDDLIPDKNFEDYDIERLARKYAAFFRVPIEQVTRFLRPLPVESNQLVSRRLFTGLEYTTQSGLPGFADIDLWSSTIQSVLMRRAGDDGYDWAQTTKAMRDRMLAAWLWVKNGTPTVTGNPILFDVIKELTSLNLTLNDQLLHDEGPLQVTIRGWVERYLRAPQPDVQRIACETVEKVIPNCTTLSWDEIFHLREQPGFQDYLAMTDGLERVTSDAEVNPLLKDINNRLFELVGDLSPSPGSVLCTGIVEEVAGWFVPGIGIATTVKETIEARQRRKNHAAIFWLMAARQKAASG